MTRIRMIGVCLLAACALASVAASAASAAAPEWYSCAKAAVKDTGKYSDKLCTTLAPESKGGYELVAGVGKGKGFKGKGGESVLNNVIPGKGDQKVLCASSKSSGTPVPGGVTGVKVIFSKCKSLGNPCSSGTKKETIETATLAGTIGYINEAEHVIGVRLSNQAEPGGVNAEFECTGLAKVRIHGWAIGVQSGDFEKISKETKTTFTVGPWLGSLNPLNGEPDPGSGYTPLVNVTNLEGGPISVLKTQFNNTETEGKWEPENGLPSGQEGSSTNKGEALEIR